MTDDVDFIRSALLYARERQRVLPGPARVTVNAVVPSVPPPTERGGPSAVWRLGIRLLVLLVVMPVAGMYWEVLLR